MLFTGWEVRIVKTCDRGLENAARGRRPRAAFSSPRSQFFTIRSDPKPVNNFFPSCQTKKKNWQNKSHARFTVTVVRDRKTRTVLTTNQIVGFVTVPAWKKLNTYIWFFFFYKHDRRFEPFHSCNRLIKAKSRIAPKNVVRLCEINRRISEVISKNRRNLLQAPIGSREWWKHVDNLWQRRCRSSRVTLDRQSLVELNDHFAELCCNNAYKQPTPAQVENGVQVRRSQKDTYGTVCSTWRKPPPDQMVYLFGCEKTTQKFLRLSFARSGTCLWSLVPGHHHGKELTWPPTPRLTFPR